MSDTPQSNPMLSSLSDFLDRIHHAVDVNDDGVVNAKDFEAVCLKAGNFLFKYFSGIVKDVAPELPGIALMAATAAVTQTGNKRDIALKGIAQGLADDTVHAAIANGTDAAVAIGDKFGVPGTIVSGLCAAAYDKAKAAHQIR